MRDFGELIKNWFSYTRSKLGHFPTFDQSERKIGLELGTWLDKTYVFQQFNGLLIIFKHFTLIDMNITQEYVSMRKTNDVR